MDSTTLLTAWEAWQLPLLPELSGQSLARQGLWAAVLGGGVGWLTRVWSRRLRLALLVTVLVWVALPGTASISHWLGLAFKAPSLSSGLLGLFWLVKALRSSPADAIGPAGPAPWSAALGWLAVLLGWLLLLDLLALLPVALYGWGFGTPALGAVCLLLLAVWMRWGAEPAAWSWLALPAVILLLFVLTRWPSGNLWDALLDPLLWLGLQLRWLLGLRGRQGSRATLTGTPTNNP